MSASVLRLALAASATVALVQVPVSGLPAAGMRQAAQNPAPAGQTRFRTATELVVVDVSAIGRDGAPVKGLEAADFKVTIDGGPRRVASVTFVDQSPVTPAAAETRRVVRYSSNQSAGAGRLILILVDEKSIRVGGLRAAAESIDRLLDGFGPADRLALATLPGPRLLVDFTSDRARIAAALKTVPGGASPSGSSLNQHVIAVVEAFAMDQGDSRVTAEVVSRECGMLRGPELQACMVEVSMEAKRIVVDERNRAAEFGAGLRGLLEGLRSIDAPKIVILFSEGFASPEAPSEFTTFSRDAAQARAVIYAMRLDRSMFDASVARVVPMTASLEERTAAVVSLDTLAGAARGAAFEIIGSAESPFKRLAAELSGYYLVGVEPESTDRDGRPHQIRVEVNRPGLTVRFRREFAFPRVVTDDAKLFAGAIGSPLVSTGLPLRVATFNLADEDPAKVRVLLVAEIDRDRRQGGPAFVGFLLTDQKGKVVLSSNRRMELPLADSGALAFVGAFSLPQGTYAMKFAAVLEGRVGSVEHRVAARLAAPDAAAGGPAGAAPQFGDVVVMPPTATGKTLTPPVDALVRGDRIVGFAQISANPKVKDDRTFRFDVVKEERGPALVGAPGVLDPAAKGRTRGVEAEVDASLLPPGDYSLRLTVSAGGTPVAALSSPFSLERTVPVKRAKPAARPVEAPAPASARFNPAEVLDPAVLVPFLGEVARLAPASSRPALELAGTGRFDEALQGLKAVKGDPTVPFLRGLSLLAKGQLQAASEAFRAAIAASPELLVGAFYIGVCYAAGGIESKAINAWQTSLIGLAQYPAVYRILADALLRAGQAERAQALLEEAMAQWPDDEAFGARAMKASLDAGRYAQVLDRADRVIERRPSDRDTLFLAMRAVFQAVIEGADLQPAALLPRLERYREQYIAAGGEQQALVAEWVAFVRGRM